MELYFDADNGALLYKTKEGYYEIVKTNAQLDPSHLRMDEEGHLYLKSYTDDSEHAMVDVSGAKISLKGPAGEKGEKGDRGEKGDQGIQGERGPKGDSGSNGTDGVNGVDGKDGHTYVPSVDLNGNLSWKLSDLAEIPSPINIRGPKGDMGEKGADGIIYTPTVSAEGVLSWTRSTDILNPQAVNIKGPKGDQGEKGDTGATGPQGEKGDNGRGFEYSFPTNPKLGDTFVWGGESGLNDNCFLGYVMTGQQYVYSQLPSKLGLTFANEKTCLIPLHVMMYIPNLLQTDMIAIQFNRSEQVHPLTFNAEDDLVESVTTTTSAAGIETKSMSWAVSYGLTDSQIKHLQPYIINIAKSIFDSKVSEQTTNYASAHRLPKYLQGSAMKCRYSDFLKEELLNKLFTFLQENPSNIFTGLQQAIADKLAENNTYDPEVYIIPIQAVPDTNLSKSWISEMPELTEGWAPCDSVLHNGFNTNQVGNIYEMPEIGGGDMQM